MPVSTILAKLMNADARAETALGILLAASIAIIAVALGFEHIGKYHPCPLCLMERYAYYFAIAASLVGVVGGKIGIGRAWQWWFLAAIAVGFLINTGLGAHHSGVEWKWWAGPSTCTGTLPSLSTGGGLDLSQPVIRCDEAPWRMMGLSFAGWNAVLSAVLAAFSIWALRRAPNHAR